jgi:signal transduction histidine kinase
MPLLELQPSIEGRRRVFVRAQLPFFGATLFVALMATIGTPASLPTANFLVGLAIIVVATAAAAFFPWERFASEWLVIVAVLDLVGVAFLRAELLPVIPSAGYVSVFPILWLSYAFRRRFLIIAIGGALLITIMPNLAAGTPPTTALQWINLIVLPVIVSAVAIAVSTAAQQMLGARRRVAQTTTDLEATLKTAQNSDTLARAILDTVDAAVSFYDANKEMVIANTNAHAIADALGFRLDVPPHSGENVFAADRVTPIPPEEQIIPRALRGDLLSSHLEWLGPVGAQTAIMANSRRVFRPDGSFHGTVIVAYDVTALADAISIREEFVTSVSHELRTPLTSVIGYLELIEDSLDEPEQIESYLRVAQRNASDLLERIAQLLAFSEKGITLNYATIDIVQLLEHALISARPAAATARITIRQMLPQTLEAHVDGSKYLQVFDNLISNAIKYTPSDGVITISLEEVDSSFVLRVSDTGRGMTPEEQRQAFDRFYRAKTARKDAIQGVGVGLSIVKEIVDAHSGTITIHSRPTHGTTMTVTLPMNASRLTT